MNDAGVGRNLSLLLRCSRPWVLEVAVGSEPECRDVVVAETAAVGHCFHAVVVVVVGNSTWDSLIAAMAEVEMRIDQSEEMRASVQLNVAHDSSTCLKLNKTWIGHITV